LQCPQLAAPEAAQSPGDGNAAVGVLQALNANHITGFYQESFQVSTHIPFLNSEYVIVWSLQRQDS